MSGRTGYRVGMQDDVADRLAATRTIEITTTGRHSGRQVRIEIWWFQAEGRRIITGTPGPRAWLANLQADPQLIVHVGDRDYSAVAHPVTDREFRRRFFGRSDPDVAWYRSQADLEDLIDNAPMVEVRLDLTHPSGRPAGP